MKLRGTSCTRDLPHVKGEVFLNLADFAAPARRERQLIPARCEVTLALPAPETSRRASRNQTAVMIATVPTTSRPVITSFRCNCILASFQNGAFRASAQELNDDRVG